MKATAKTIHAATAALLFALPFLAGARKIRTKHSIPKQAAQEKADGEDIRLRTITLATDSIALCDSIAPAIRFYGFDKTASSNTESLFITNCLTETLTALELEITYIDMKGRQLHKRTVTIDCTIPPGETMRTDFKTWDTQKSFYFHQSVKPKRQATSFDVRLRLLSISINDDKEKNPE